MIDRNAGMDRVGYPNPCSPMNVHSGEVDVLFDHDIRKQYQAQWGYFVSWIFFSR